MDKLQIQHPIDLIYTKKEPDEKNLLSGQIDYKPHSLDPLGKSRYGKFYINLISDLYLFQIAVDYHFHFVKNCTKIHNIGINYLFEGAAVRRTKVRLYIS